MKLVFEPCGSKKATISVTIDAGSDVEYPDKWTSGIAHLIEHMSFQGTSDLSHFELSRQLATLGVDYNAYTSHDKVFFYMTAPAENIIETSHLCSKMLLNREFDNDLFEKEKLVVLEEELGARDDVDSNIVNNLLKFLCGGPLSTLIIGTEESIKSISLEEAQRFHSTYYRPENMLITVSGPKDLDCSKISEYFAPDTNVFNLSEKQNSFYKYDKEITTYDKRIQQPRVFVGHRAFSYLENKTLVLKFMNKFFSEDMDSRLFQSLRQKHGLCYCVTSYTSIFKEVGWDIVYVKTSEENVSKSVELINEEISNLLKDGPTDEEITRAKNKYISEIYSSLETSYGVNMITSHKKYLDLPTIEENIERIKNMTVNEIKNVCNEVFDEENRQVFVCLPEKEEK